MTYLNINQNACSLQYESLYVQSARLHYTFIIKVINTVS